MTVLQVGLGTLGVCKFNGEIKLLHVDDYMIYLQLMERPGTRRVGSSASAAVRRISVHRAR